MSRLERDPLHSEQFVGLAKPATADRAPRASSSVMAGPNITWTESSPAEPPLAYSSLA
jgi:hypothetical protein